MTLTLSQNTETAINEVITVIDALQVVYEHETKALEALDTKTFYALQNDKIIAAQNYQSSIQSLMTRKDELKKAPETSKNLLREKQKNFHALSTKNMDALKRMNRLSKRLADTIHRAARDTMEDQQTRQYSGTGQMQGIEKKALSMGVNETA